MCIFLVDNAEWKQCINRNRFSGFQSLEVFFFGGGHLPCTVVSLGDG